MESDFQVRVATGEFTSADGKVYGRGTLLIGKGESGLDDQAFFNTLAEIAKESTVDIYALTTGYTGGLNVGSPNMVTLDKPEIALLVEGGVDSYEAGEIWHLLDQRYEMPITLLPMDRIGGSTLDRYNVILMPDGRYSSLGKSGAATLKSWISGGGTLLAKGGAIQFLSENEVGDFKFRDGAKADSAVQKSYADYENESGARVTGGAIFNAKLDLTHPIGYGYINSDIHTFRNDNLFMEPSENPYANPLVYTDKPLASGYLHPSNLEGIQNGSVIQVAGVGRGRIVAFADNMNFRAFWFGTNKLYMNAIFFGQVIQGGTAR